jgi:adenylate cyclase
LPHLAFFLFTTLYDILLSTTAMKKTLIPIIIGIGITVLFSFFSIIRFLPLERLELLLYNARYLMQGKLNPPPDNVIIVAIDDRSIEKMGRWPWDRDRMADIIDIISAMGPKVIMPDIIWSEPYRGDNALANAIKRAGNVALPISFDMIGEEKIIQNDMLMDNTFLRIQKENSFKNFHPISARNILLPTKQLAENTAALGHINIVPDKPPGDDGVLRWEVMVIEYGGNLYPSIDLQIARLYLGVPMESIVLNATESVQIKDALIPTDRWGRTLIHYYGPHNTFPYISILDIIEKKIDPSLLKGKIVLLGPTGMGTHAHDLWITPTSPVMPGIEKHAHVVSSILKKDFITRAGWILNALIILISGILFSLLIVRVKAIAGASLSFVFIAILSVISYYLFFFKGLWTDLSYSGNNILITYFVVTAYRYATEERYARQIRQMFSSYVTEKVVNELIKNPDLAKLGGARREITVLFSDIRGFTNFSEKHSPEEVVAILNEYLGEMTNIIFKWDGTLDKFVGDEIVAFWGAPLPQENHAELAMKCTLHMIQRLKELREKWTKDGREPLYAGFGLNTGEVIVGNIGAEGKKMDYTVIGDNVNLGARVEGLTRKYNADIIITESTLNRIRALIAEGKFGHVKVEGLDLVAVKGKIEPVRIYGIRSLDEGNICEIIECEQSEVTVMKEK